jgi:hypothetical protein
MRTLLEIRYVSKQKWTANVFKTSSKRKRRPSKPKQSTYASRKRRKLKNSSRKLNARNSKPFWIKSESVLSKKQNFQLAWRQRRWQQWKLNFKRKWSPSLSNKESRLKGRLKRRNKSLSNSASKKRRR